jgi:hypothetical protein
VDDPDPFAAEDLLERGREFAVAVVDQESHPFEHSGEAEVARLLGHPGAGRVGRAARQMDAATFELDEEQDVQAAERDRLDGEEIAREHARRLLAEELAPARACTHEGRLETRSEQDAPHRAWRRAQAEPELLAGDPRVAPTRVLACEPQHELTHAIVNRRTSRARLRPRDVGTPAARTRPQIRPDRITLVPVAEVPREQFDLGKRHGQRGAMPVSPWDEPASSWTLEERRAYLLGYQNGRVSAASGTSAASTAKRRAARS